MALKLLKPSEAKTAEEERRSEDIRRAESIRDITKSLMDENVQAEQRFHETLETQRSRWEKEDTERLARKQALEREIETLEKRRERALIPIVEREEKLHTAEEALTVREAELDERETSLDDNSRALMLRLDEVSERENKVDILQRGLTRRKSGIEAQSEQTAKNARAIAVQMVEFESTRQQQLHEISQREAIADARLFSLDEREKRMSETDAELHRRELLLADRFGVLQRTIEEMKKK